MRGRKALAQVHSAGESWGQELGSAGWLQTHGLNDILWNSLASPTSVPTHHTIQVIHQPSFKITQDIFTGHEIPKQRVLSTCRHFRRCVSIVSGCHCVSSLFLYTSPAFSLQLLISGFQQFASDLPDGIFLWIYPAWDLLSFLSL